MHFQQVGPHDDEAFLGGHAEEPGIIMQPSAGDLDDVFGSDDGTFTEPDPAASGTHPSDIRRLESEHTTAGYREGVTVAKAKSIQAGFDEGFSLGATIGLRAGQLLGTIEAIAEALRAGDERAAKGAEALLEAARGDLSARAIFSPDYWAPDGNWTFPVEARGGSPEDVLFPDVAEAHPLIRKWTTSVEEQIRLWNIDRTVLDQGNETRIEIRLEDQLSTSTAPTTRKPLDW